MDGNSQVAIVKALIAARKAIGPVRKDAKNPHLNNAYATLGAVLDAVIGPLLDHGIVVTQTPVPIEGGRWALQTTLRHEDGGDLTGLVPLEYAEAKGLNPMQSLGSAVSYARRYGLLSLVCLAAEDDDGAGAGAGPPRKQATDRRPDRPASPDGQRPRRAPESEMNGKEIEQKRSAAIERIHRNPPRTGRHLYKDLLDIAPDKSLLHTLSNHAKEQGWNPRTVDFDERTTAKAVAFVRRELEEAAVADRDRN